MARTQANDSRVLNHKKGRLHTLSARKEDEFNRTKSRLSNKDGLQGQIWGHDGEDDFHRQRDQVLLEHTSTRGGNKNHHDLDELEIDDEIYSLDLPDSHSNDDDDDDDDSNTNSNEEEEEAPLQKRKKKEYKRNLKLVDQVSEPKGRFAKSTIMSIDRQDSFGSESDSSQGEKERFVETIPNESDSEEERSEKAADSEDEEETWAPGSYHVSRRKPGQADSEDEEALELEEAEARRIQKRNKTLLQGQDFGFDQDEEDEQVREVLAIDFEDPEENKSKEKGEQKRVDWTEEDAIAHLLKHNPETLALLDDFAKTAERVKLVEKVLDQLRKGEHDQGEEHRALAIVELEHQALVTYLPTLTFYFSLLLSSNPSRDLLNSVLSRLSSLRMALASMEELELTSQVDDSDSEDDDEDDEDGMLLSDVWDRGGMAVINGDSSDEEGEEEEEDVSYDEDEDIAELAQLEDGDDDDDGFDSEEFDSDEEDAKTESMLHGLSDADLEQLMKDMKGDRDADALIAKVKEIQAKKKGVESKGRKTKRDAVVVEQQATPKASSKKNKKAKQQVVIPELPALSRSSIPKKAKKREFLDEANDYLDPTSLTHGDSSDKASARHSLRFHVSQVSQKERRRNEGHGRRIGGDDDLPRRSKENARREVLKKQQHGVAPADGAALDGDEWGEEDIKAAKAVRGSVGDQGQHENPIDYYEEIKAEKEQGRKAKKAKHDDARMAEKEELMSLAESSVDGPRGATRTILANKGLTPRRSKASRNSRVKKRLQYDKALKKVSSMKAVYKGGDRSHYDGEKTGIGKNTVKSIRLNK